jgi:hypothetical protein
MAIFPKILLELFLPTLFKARLYLKKLYLINLIRTKYEENSTLLCVFKEFSISMIILCHHHTKQVSYLYYVKSMFGMPNMARN